MTTAKRRKSFSDILTSCLMAQHISMNQTPPPPYKSNACCISTERPRTPDEYLCDLICSIEMNDSNSTDILPGARVLRPQNTPQANSFKVYKELEDIKRSIQLTVTQMVKNRYFSRSDDSSHANLGDFWDIINAGADLLSQVCK